MPAKVLATEPPATASLASEKLPENSELTVAPEHALYRLDRATFKTQQGRILDAGARVVEERLPGISVIQAADVPAISGDVKDSQADISKAHRLLGYQPAVTFEDGLKRTIEWYRAAIAASVSS